MKVKTKDTVEPAQFMLTPDEIRYMIHISGKQMQKLEHAKSQLYSTIAKLEIMLEVAKETK